MRNYADITHQEGLAMLEMVAAEVVGDSTNIL